eukprot:CAMPEP_0170617296 /NCGR_PEP_ID=MMETSP0224-20130122/26339_1 /TAXON_ID=285029 /ORGANISM="Togula jolla, Strain CCCM 725" /LENGTH=522 /DNA_ID=CAMNT_0010943173 /DNA_START=43 /DNA_END=1608 /DNA_ORIENTATION=-
MASLREQGNASFKAGDFGQAKQSYTVALLESPLDAVLWSNRSAAHLSLGCPHLAAADAIRSLELDSTLAKSHFRLGNAFMKMTGFKQAIRYFESCEHLRSDALVSKKLLEARESYEKGPTETQQALGQDGRFSSFYSPSPTSRAALKPSAVRELNELYVKSTTKCNVEIRTSSARGALGLFATADAEAGDVLLEESPLLATCCNPARCTACTRLLGLEAVDCDSCGAERYCGAACRNSAWEQYHKTQCGDVAREFAVLRSRLQRREDVSAADTCHVLAAVRIAGMISQGNCSGGLSDLPEMRYLYSLTDDADPDILSQILHPFKSRYSQWTMLSAILKLDAVGHVMFDLEFYDELWHVLSANVMADSATNVSMLPRFLAFANHSCSPNATAELKEGQIRLRALGPIRSGEEVFVAYVDSNMPRSARLQALRNRYWFVCKCARCHREEDAAPIEDDDWLREAESMMGPVRILAQSQPGGQEVLAFMERYGWNGSSFRQPPDRHTFEEEFRAAFGALRFEQGEA